MANIRIQVWAFDKDSGACMSEPFFVKKIKGEEAQEVLIEECVDEFSTRVPFRRFYTEVEIDED